MKKFLIVIFLHASLISNCYAQEWDDTCEEATTRASKDFENGIMKATSYGLPVLDDYYFEEFFDQYLWNEYGVTSSNGGCVITESLECYSSRMYALIEERFGKNFFKKARKEARKLYIPKEQEIINDYNEKRNDGAYIVVDVMPEFNGGFEKLFEYVNNQIETSPIELDTILTRSFVSFVIDSTGQSKNVKIIKGSDANLDSLLVRIFEQMPTWTPGKLHDKNVNVKMVVPIKH